jgi:MFS family permease
LDLACYQRDLKGSSSTASLPCSLTELQHDDLITYQLATILKVSSTCQEDNICQTTTLSGENQHSAQDIQVIIYQPQVPYNANGLSKSTSRNIMAMLRAFVRRENGDHQSNTRLNTMFQRAKDELGFTTLAKAPSDVHVLLLTRSIRMFAYGSTTLILAIYFSSLGFSDFRIGLFLTLTLVGDVGISLLLTFVADTLGRRKILTAGGLLMLFSGVTFAMATNYWILLFAAVVGVISPSGNEIGPFRAVEESTLAQLSKPETRSDVFAWYVVAGTLGGAAGSLTCGWFTQALQSAGYSEQFSYRLMFWLYGTIGLVKAGITGLLTEACEAKAVAAKPTADQTEESEAFLPSEQQYVPPSQPPPAKKSAVAHISPSSRTILAKLCGLFFFDSLASGMVPNSLIVLYISRKFRLEEGKLGTIIAAAQFVSSIGNIFASSVAKRIGLVKTMVFTHLPSAILLALIPAAGSLALTIVLVVGRASLASMDQAPRSAFLSAVVKAEERTAVMGVVNTVKTFSQSSGPLITGLLAGGSKFWIAFLIAGALKTGYDLGMLSMFANLKLEGDARHEGREVDEVQEFELESADEESDGEDEDRKRRAHR